MARRTIIDSTGQEVDIDSLPQTSTFNGPGGANDTITARDPLTGKQWVLTYTFTGFSVTGTSQWTPQ
jgi:hypothetical protein